MQDSSTSKCEALGGNKVSLHPYAAPELGREKTAHSQKIFPESWQFAWCLSETRGYSRVVSTKFHSEHIVLFGSRSQREIQLRTKLPSFMPLFMRTQENS